MLPVNKVYGGRQQSLHNNIEYNTSNIYSAKFDKNDAFKRFWSVYPRHTNKKKAFDVFVKKCTDETVLQKMLSALLIIKRQNSGRMKDLYLTLPHGLTAKDGKMKSVQFLKQYK